MGKRYTEEMVRRILDRTGERMGLLCREVPVEISARMKRTYGSFCFRISNGNLQPVAFRFSEKLLSGDYPDRIVEETILHEYAHFYTNVKSNANHGHDRSFKETCRKLGIPGLTRFSGNHSEEIRWGYRIFCSKCQNEVARRRRIDSARTLTGKYLSGCCGERLRISRERF